MAPETRLFLPLPLFFLAIQHFFFCPPPLSFALLFRVGCEWKRGWGYFGPSRVFTTRDMNFPGNPSKIRTILDLFNYKRVFELEGLGKLCVSMANWPLFPTISPSREEG